MELDDFAKGAVASLLSDVVGDKTGLAYRVGWVGTALALLGSIFLDGWWRALAIVVLLLFLAALVFVFITKRLATAVINRIAPPVDLANARQHFDTAIAEADLPTGPVGFLKLVWRLRKGIGPEVERLGAVVTRLKSELD